MNKRITVFLPLGRAEDTSATIEEILQSEQIEDLYVLQSKDAQTGFLKEGVQTFGIDGVFSSGTVRLMASHTTTEFILLYTKTQRLRLGPFALERMLKIAEDTDAAWIYSDYYQLSEGLLKPNPVIDYQQGSLRDDFNFGSLILIRTSAMKEAVSLSEENYHFAGIYDLRLKISGKHMLFHIPELLYTEVETDSRQSGEKMFDYVNPKNREVQIEMEQVCTTHLKACGAWLKPLFKTLDFHVAAFETEASVIIPVKNRAGTIADAVCSVLNQKTDFAFNVIVVNNHSDDGTNEILDKFSGEDSRVIHIIPERHDLGIGGCWNEAVSDSRCGKFAVQLDSDDLYIDDTVLSRIVTAFYKQNCAMLVGSYQMVNFKLEEIPPGIIDHREWTDDNGRNNALRVNGLGAPRAFYTPVIRTVKVPNVSYGEDYALGLAISRYYRIGRIYEPLYLCRRWEGNSDASLDVQKLNTYNFYKDKIRTMEYLARQLYVKKGQPV